MSSVAKHFACAGCKVRANKSISRVAPSRLRSGKQPTSAASNLSVLNFATHFFRSVYISQ
jgi:hypothetical protein